MIVDQHKIKNTLLFKLLEQRDLRFSKITYLYILFKTVFGREKCVVLDNAYYKYLLSFCFFAQFRCGTVRIDTIWCTGLLSIVPFTLKIV